MFVSKLLYTVRSYKVLLTMFFLCTPKENAIKGLDISATMISKQTFRGIHELWKHTFASVCFKD